MASDNLWTEYHLTPHGWVEGTERFFQNVTKKVERPQDAVETWQQHIYQRSDWSPEETTVSMIWHDPSKSEEERKHLRDKFPRRFGGREK